MVGIISAFNFPVAVYAWNTALALIAGDTVSGSRPSRRRSARWLPMPCWPGRPPTSALRPDSTELVLGGREIGQALVEDPRVALVSATGSVRMGREIAPLIAARFGRALLELGGNNACIVAPSADLDLALRGIVFSAAGTAGQRCTTLRRLIVHTSVVDRIVPRIVDAYRTLSIGSPTVDGTPGRPADQRCQLPGPAGCTRGCGRPGRRDPLRR